VMDKSGLRRKDTTKGPPLRVLSLDGGGVRGYSMLIILQELMYRVYVECEGKAPRREEIPKPCDYFDLIAGTGTGGLIALMLGRLRLDLETCKDVYVRMTKKVFETDKTIAGIPYRSTLFKASKLEEAIRECVREHTVFEAEGNDLPRGGSRNSMAGPPFSPSSVPQRSLSRGSVSTMGASNPPSTPLSQRGSTFINGLRWGNPDALLYDNREYRTKTAVTALYKGTTKHGSAVLLRSYDSRKEPPPEFNCTVWQAGRATSATGLAFKPIQIGQHVFIDEGAGTYNPAPQVLDEATVNEWPGREIGVFVSIGTGKRPSGTNSRQHEWWEDFFGDSLGTFAEARRRLISKIEGCEDIHLAMLRNHLGKRNVSQDNYFRWNVEVGVGEFGMNEWNRLADISTNTRRYLAKPEVKKSILEAGVRFARIERMHRRLAARAAAANEDGDIDGDDSLPTDSSAPVVSASSAPTARPSNEFAIELPAEVPSEYLHRTTNSAARPPSRDTLPHHPTPQERLHVPPARRSAGEVVTHHSPASHGSPPRRSADNVYEPMLPPPVPPKTPIPYPTSQPSELAAEISTPSLPHHLAMPVPPGAAFAPSGGAQPLAGKIRPPYPDDEPPVVNKHRKPSYHNEWQLVCLYSVHIYRLPCVGGADCAVHDLTIFLTPASLRLLQGQRFLLFHHFLDLILILLVFILQIHNRFSVLHGLTQVLSSDVSNVSNVHIPIPRAASDRLTRLASLTLPLKRLGFMDLTGALVSHAADIVARSDSSSSERSATYKVVGITLAASSGLFIGVSFVLKKVGLLKANAKYNEEAGEGYGYLKNVWWWSGMTLMILGEICNFVAYAFVDAILVTPLGALSVVITTILSAIFLKERLSFVGKVGCFSCILGSVVIALNAPQQSSVSDIQEMKSYVIAPGFLSYAGVIIVGAIFTALWVAPRYGKKSMFVYLSICSMVGGLSVVATQGLGSAILAQINGEAQFNQWFMYVLLVFVICTLLTEIIYLNKALNLFNAALVTPTYYVFFTSATIITSAILFRGFKGTAIEITTVILGFFQICSGVVLLQLSKSAKDIPDAAVFKGDLDQIREVAAVEDPESEPKADSIRGTAAIIRRISTARRKMEVEEARRYFRERQEDQLNPPSENEIIEWDGLRRRKTVIGEGPTMSRPRTPRTPGSVKSYRPPLGMSRFPEEEEVEEGEVNNGGDTSKVMSRPSTKQGGHSFFQDLRSRASTMLHSHHSQPAQWHSLEDQQHLDDDENGVHPVAMTNISVDTSYHGHEMAGRLQPPFQLVTGRQRSDTPRSISWADEVQGEQSPSQNSHLAPDPPPHGGARRQFSFNTVFNRTKATASSAGAAGSPSRGILRRSHRNSTADQRQAVRNATEEERLGLVKGDSRATDRDDDLMDEKLERRWSSSSSNSSSALRSITSASPPRYPNPLPPLPFEEGGLDGSYTPPPAGTPGSGPGKGAFL
ncbi:hypothetical protein ASPZODRAFT_55806, partial [Penicilliopsis zonata CBS 506.65]